MDFRFTEQQEMFRDSVLAFARKELADGALERAHSAQFPHEVAKKMAEAGLLGITIPEKDGGSGGTNVLEIDIPSNSNPNSLFILVPGEGVRCYTNIYATLTNLASVTVFYG